jgi:hypothetical protein
MTQKVSHGAATREPVYLGNRRVSCLWRRTLATGGIVYEAKLRLDGRQRTVRLRADNKT